MTRSRKPTLSDVAVQAGVSITTASYILNGRSAQMRIAPETEARVREAMARLGYRPNQSARSLRTATTRTLGLISDRGAGGLSADQRLLGQLLLGAAAAARELEHLLVIGETGGEPEAEALLIEEMGDRRVDGIVYAGLAHARVRLPAQLTGQRVVLLNCVDPESDVPAVVPDERGGGRAAVDVLLAAGIHDGIVVVGGSSADGELAGSLRTAGAAARLAELGLALAGVLDCPWGVRSAYDAVCGWLAHGGRAQALVCLDGRVAMGACQALAEAGVKVPEEMSVVSFDATEVTTWLRPAVTSVALPLHEMGEVAVRVLLGRQPAERLVEVPMRLVRGDSVNGPGATR